MNRRHVSILFCLCCIATLWVFLSAAPQAAGPKQASQAATIAQQRFDVADRGYQITAAQLKRGLGSNQAMVEWLRRRADAARDLPDAAKRSDVLQDCVEQLKARVSYAERSQAAATGTELDVLSARDAELEVELWLSKAQEK